MAEQMVEQIVEQMAEMIYSITFHVKPGRKVHTFWYTDKAKALAFLESVKKHPKVATATEYDGIVEEGRITPVNTD
jgi:hypothetical protein